MEDELQTSCYLLCRVDLQLTRPGLQGPTRSHLSCWSSTNYLGRAVNALEHARKTLWRCASATQGELSRRPLPRLRRDRSSCLRVLRPPERSRSHAGTYVRVQPSLAYLSAAMRDAGHRTDFSLYFKLRTIGQTSFCDCCRAILSSSPSSLDYTTTTSRHVQAPRPSRRPAAPRSGTEPMRRLLRRRGQL